MRLCSECDYYEPVNGNGRCKEDAPHLSPTIAGTTGVWPTVDGNKESCGKFKNETPA